MDSKSAVDTQGFISQVTVNLEDFWSNLSDSQQAILKKIWMILTYKWQWQIILNTPFLVIWILDQTFPSVHSFNMKIISSLPIPMAIKTLVHFG